MRCSDRSAHRGEEEVVLLNLLGDLNDNLLTLPPTLVDPSLILSAALAYGSGTKEVTSTPLFPPPFPKFFFLELIFDGMCFGR